MEPVRRFSLRVEVVVAQLSSVARLFGFRSWLLAFAGALATLILTGVPTAIIDNPLFIRMTPVRTQDYVIWVTTAVLVGLIVGTFALPAGPGPRGKILSGGFLSFLAIGCPICNKLVVLLLGTSGALTFFAPAQLYIGIGSIVLLGWALHLRVQAVNRACCYDSSEVTYQELIPEACREVGLKREVSS